MKGQENLTIFSGWRDESILREGVDLELDFLILSANTKTIIQIECKTEYQPKALSKAVNQLQRGKKFFQDYFKFSEGWRYVKAAYFHSRKNAPESEFILDHESNLNQFFDDHLQPSETPDTTTYLEMVKVLMFVLFHYSKSIITSRDSALRATKDIEEFGSAENIIFWTKDQLELQNPACTKVAFYSTYGTGKTQLLKWKIQEVLKKWPEKKVVFIVCENENDPSRSLLADQIKSEFQSEIANNKIIFKCIKTKSEMINKFATLKEAIRQHEGANIFIDEMPFYMSVDLDVKSFLNEQLQDKQVVWIAIQWDSIQHKRDDNDSAVRGQLPIGFFCPDLKHPLRTSANIMKFSNLEIVSVSWVPEQINPDHYVQRGPEVKILEIKRSSKLETVQKVVNILKALNLPTVIVICGEEPNDQMTKDLFLEIFKDSNLGFVEQADFISKINEFNKSADGQPRRRARSELAPLWISKKMFIGYLFRVLGFIFGFSGSFLGSLLTPTRIPAPVLLVETAGNENILRGFEIPVLVLFRYKSILYDDITLSRCTSNMIIVLEEELFKDNYKKVSVLKNR